MYDLAPIRDTSLNIALKLTDDEIERLSPLKLPAVQKRLTIAYGEAELPALVCDAQRMHEARVAQGAPGDLVAIGGADHFTILEQLRRRDGRLVEAARSLIDA